jgi:putative transposase
MSQKKSAELMAWAILPDHFHVIVNCEKVSVSSYVQSVKQSFSAKYRAQTAHRNRVWQLRFWDHIIRDERDFRNHLDYIHYNPVKHGLVVDSFSYPFSSASVFLKRGQYERDWGVLRSPEFNGEFGE